MLDRMLERLVIAEKATFEGAFFTMKKNVNMDHWIDEDEDGGKLDGHPSTHGIVLGHFIFLHGKV